MLAIKSILFPTDFSAFAEGALPLACALARDHGATLILLHVRPTPESAYGEFGAVPPEPPEPMETVQEKLRRLPPPGFTGRAEFHVLDGDPADKILDLAKQSQANLIVIGTHGRSGLSRVLLGSVAEEVLRKASCPVLTVNVKTGQK